MFRTPLSRGLPSTFAWLVAGLGLVLATQASAQEGSANLLRNPSVEEGVLFAPTGWDTTVSGLPTVRFGWSEEEAAAGEKSLYIFNSSDIVPMWHNWSQLITDVGDVVGKQVTFRAKLKTRQLSGRAYLLVQAYSDTVTVEAIRTGTPRLEMRKRMGILPADDPQTELGWSRIYIDGEQEDWTEYEASVYIPKGTNLVLVRAGIFGIGEVWYDDLSLVATKAPKEKAFPKNQNLLVNEGFENGFDGWDYSLVPIDGLRVRLADNAHSGSYCAAIDSQGRPPVQLVSTLFQVLNTRQLSGKRVRLSGWIRSEGLDNSQGYLRLYGTGAYGDFKPPATKSVSGTTEWIFVSTEAEIPEDTYSVWAQAGMSTNYGVFFVDDLKLEVVDSVN